MKNTMITSIYYGNPPPFERKPPIPVAETPRGRVKTAREALLATLTSEQAALLEAYDTAMDIWAEEGRGIALPRAFAWAYGWVRSALGKNRGWTYFGL